MIWNEKARDACRADALAQVQIERLQATLNRALRNVAFYRESFARSGREGRRGARPWRTWRGCPSPPRRTCAPATPTTCSRCRCGTSCASTPPPGTTGTPVVVGYTRNDLKTWSECVARLLAAGGMSEHDVVQVAFTYGLFSGGLRAPPRGGADRRLRDPRLGGRPGEAGPDHAGLQDHRPGLHAELRPGHRRGPGRDGRVTRASSSCGRASSARSPGARACARGWSRASASRRWTTTASPRSSGPGVSFECERKDGCTSTRTTSSPRSSTRARSAVLPAAPRGSWSSPPSRRKASP